MDLFSAVPLFPPLVSGPVLNATIAYTLQHIFNRDLRSGVVRLYLDYSSEMAIESGMKAV